jgi:hypothetical protein
VAGEKVVPYPAATTSAAPGSAGKAEVPVAISLTEFHYLLLYPSKLLAISKLSGEVVFEQGFKERFGEMRGMVTDPCSPGSTMPVVWLFSNRHVAVFAFATTAQLLFVLVWPCYSLSRVEAFTSLTLSKRTEMYGSSTYCWQQRRTTPSCLSMRCRIARFAAFFSTTFL